MDRRRRWTWAWSAVGVAATVAAALVVAPNLVADTIEPNVTGPPPPTPVPTGTPTAGATQSPTAVPAAGLPDGWVTTDGTAITLRRADGTTTTLYEQDPTGESRIEAVEVRPGATTDDLTVVFLAQAEGAWDLRYVNLRDGEVSWDYVPRELQISTQATPDARPVPAYSPDGSHLAWLETRRGEDNQAAVLKVIGWTDEGPGTGDTATDNAEFTVESISVTEVYGGFTIEDWTWEPDAGQAQTKDGLLYVTAGAEAWAIPVQEQADGGIALDPGARVQLVEVDGAAVIDVAAVQSGKWLLTAAGRGQGEVMSFPRSGGHP